MTESDYTRDPERNLPHFPFMLSWMAILAADPTLPGNHAGGGGFIGWPLVFGSLMFMHVWLMVYSVFLSGQRSQGVYYWMFLTLLFGPFAIFALLRQPIVANCPACGAESPRSEAVCPVCGTFMASAWHAEAPAGSPEAFEDDRLTS